MVESGDSNGLLVCLGAPSNQANGCAPRIRHQLTPDPSNQMSSPRRIKQIRRTTTCSSNQSDQAIPSYDRRVGVLIFPVKNNADTTEVSKGPTL